MTFVDSVRHSTRKQYARPRRAAPTFTLSEKRSKTNCELRYEEAMEGAAPVIGLSRTRRGCVCES